MKADLHVHTNFSYDGHSSPEEVVDAAIAKGLSCICITDHHETEGAVQAMKYASDKNILVMPGIEILTRSGDVLGINVKKLIPDGLTVEETILRIRGQGGIALIPHPFAVFMSFLGGSKRLAKLDFDAIEIFNSAAILNPANSKALEFATNHGFSFSAGSDAHRAQFIGRGYLEYQQPFSSERAVMDGIKEKRVIAQGRQLSFPEFFMNASTGIRHGSNIVRYLGSMYKEKAKNILSRI